MNLRYNQFSVSLGAWPLGKKNLRSLSLITIPFFIHGGKMRLTLRSKVTSQKFYGTSIKFNLVCHTFTITFNSSEYITKTIDLLIHVNMSFPSSIKNIPVSSCWAFWINMSLLHPILIIEMNLNMLQLKW